MNKKCTLPRVILESVAIGIIFDLGCYTEKSIRYAGEFESVVRDFCVSNPITEKYEGQVLITSNRRNEKVYWYEIALADHCLLSCSAYNNQELHIDSRFELPICNIQIKNRAFHVAFNNLSIRDRFSPKAEGSGKHKLMRFADLIIGGVIVDQIATGGTVSLIFKGSYDEVVEAGTYQTCIKEKPIIRRHCSPRMDGGGCSDLSDDSVCQEYKTFEQPLPDSTYNYIPLKCRRIL